MCAGRKSIMKQVTQSVIGYNCEIVRPTLKFYLGIDYRHYEYMPMQYTEIFKVEKNEIFQ